MSIQESRAERAWNWFLRFMGAGVFIAAAATGGKVGYGIAFMGICVAALPISDFREMIKGIGRRIGGSGSKEPPT